MTGFFFRHLRLLAAALACLIAPAGLAGGGAFAHAIPMESSPAVNAVLPPGEINVLVRFNSRIDGRRSALSLRGPGNVMLPLVLSIDKSELILTGHAVGLTPGDWLLRWQVLSIDGHITHGLIPFSVTP